MSETTLKFLSVLDCVQVSGGARYGFMAPNTEAIAALHHLLPERLCDDLDYFDIFVVKSGDVVLGFRSYFRGGGTGSLVSVWPRDASGVADLIATIARIPATDVEVYSEDW